MKIIQIAIALLYLTTSVNAQLHQSVFPGLEGTDLLNATADSYKPATVLGYGPARDTMYATIYNEQDSVRGIYTNHAVFVPKGSDPSVAIFMNGSDNGINAEHTYPQSKGARNGNAKSDMHHLFPSKTPVNADRGSLEFKEIPDNQTTTWYYKTTERSSIPDTNIDLFSEGTSNGFEPAEAKKGNIARAMFYFYTMYKSEADSADPDFFENQRETLCNWHFLDPVDSLEWERTFMIAKHQDNKANPFVLDCSLASRSYCEGISGICDEISSVEFNKPAYDENFHIYPNPSIGMINLEFEILQKADISISFYNKIGQRILKIPTTSFHAGKHKLQNHFEISGFIFAKIEIQGQGSKKVLMKKFFVKK